MALLATYTQQPADVLDYDIDYNADESPWLLTGDALASAVATVTPVGLTVATPLVVGSKIKLWISGGTTGTTYKVTLTTTTTLGRVKQDELKFKIKDI